MQIPRFFSVWLRYLTLTIFVLAVSGCQMSSENKTKTPVTVSYLDKLQIPFVAESINGAVDLAQDWQDDAFLHSVNVIPGWIDRPQPAILRFDFRSQNYANERLAVVFTTGLDRENSVRTDFTDITTASKDFREITSNDWSLDADEAFQIAQQYGGEDYLRDSGLGAQVELFLEYQKGVTDGPVVWRVTYLRPDGGGNLQIILHAITGEVLRVIQ